MLAVSLAAPLAAERSRDPAAASVFIRVIGTVTIEDDSSWTETREERDVELGSGSGFVVSSYGHVLTNYHVVSGESITERFGGRDLRVDLEVDRVEVVFPSSPDGSGPARFEATVEATDPDLDLAVLAINAPELPYLALGDSEASVPGQPVAVYGFPFGREVEVGKANLPDIVPQVSVSKGAVSATRSDDAGRSAFLQTTATVNPGNSGGPMVDEEGFVLGVVRLKLRGGDGIGFAIPVNAVKDFLEFRGYGQLLPVERLRLGPEESLPGKGIALRLPDTMEDRSPARLVAFSSPEESAVRFRAERVASPLGRDELERLLLAGGTFGSFQAGAAPRSQVDPATGLLVGSATGVDAATGEEAKLTYALYEHEAEKVLVHYDGPAEALAFNASVLLDSVRSLRVEPLLTEPIETPLSLAGLRWVKRPLPEPRAPSLVVPEGWLDERSAPFACRGLPPLDSALALSPPGDFTVSLRAGWWLEGPPAAEAAAACGRPSRELQGSSYAYVLDWLGLRYVVEGLFVPRGGSVLQLELVAPVDKQPLVRELALAWMGKN